MSKPGFAAGRGWMVGVLLWLAWPAMAAEQIELKLHLTPGQSMRQELKVEQQIDQSMMNQPAMKMTQLMGFTMRFEVLDRPANPGGAWVKLTYTRVQFVQDGPMGHMAYDSEDPPASVPMMARGFQGLVDRTLQVQFDADGEVVTIEGIEAMIDQVIASMDLPEGPAKDAAEQATRSQLNQDTMKQMMSMGSAAFPDRPVAVGDQWDDQQAMGGMMPMTIQSAYTFDAFDDDTATLAFDGKVMPNPEAQPFAMGESDMDMEFTGTMTGETVLDRQTGWTRSALITQDLDGGMTINTADGQSMNIDMKIVSKTTITTLE